MSASGTQSDEDKGEISKYLSRKVEAVALTERLGDNSTYPPLLLDGASGTGKTQQAFALVKKHNRIIYFLMSDEAKGAVLEKEQEIYRRMRFLTKDMGTFRFAHRVDEAMKALLDRDYYEDLQICSVCFLRETINLAGAGNMPIVYDTGRGCWARNSDGDSKWLDPLMDVVLWMCSKRLQYVNGGLQVVPITFGDNTKVKFVDLYSQLKHVILFLDEALPPRELWPGDRPDAVAIDRLRFVRNLGRALTMKVVLAGTGATAANLTADPKPPKPQPWLWLLVASRTRGSNEDMEWIECQFLWNTMSYNDLKEVLPNLVIPKDWQKDLILELTRSRPYLVHLFGRVMNRLKDDLDNSLYCFRE